MWSIFWLIIVFAAGVTLEKWLFRDMRRNVPLSPWVVRLRDSLVCDEWKCHSWDVYERNGVKLCFYLWWEAMPRWSYVTIGQKRCHTTRAEFRELYNMAYQLYRRKLAADKQSLLSEMENAVEKATGPVVKATEVKP